MEDENNPYRYCTAEICYSIGQASTRTNIMQITKTLLVFCALLWPSLASADIKLLRHPSYHKGKVAFSYLGDIWVASEDGSAVTRHTDHRARDIYPRFSPDGAWIAFSSNRAGNYDIYVAPTAGGKPRVCLRSRLRRKLCLVFSGKATGQAGRSH